METATSGQGATEERKYKGSTYYVIKKEEGWMNIVYTPDGKVENGFFANEFTAEVDAHDTINLVTRGTYGS